MKNISKRTKIILAIVGVVVIVTVTIGIFAQVGGGELFGTTALVITPSNPSIIVGHTTDLTVNAKYDCSWASSNTNVSIINYCDGVSCPERKTITVQANANGTAVIAAQCGWSIFDVNVVKTTVTGYTPPLVITPSQPRVSVNGWVELSVPSPYTCTWSSSNPSAVAVSTKTGSSGIAEGRTAGQSATVTAQCGTGGSTSTVVSVNP